LVVADALGQIVVPDHLHLQVEGILPIDLADKDIQADALAVPSDINRLLPFRVRQFLDLNMENLLQQPLAYLWACLHRLAEDEVVLYGKLFP